MLDKITPTENIAAQRRIEAAVDSITALNGRLENQAGWTAHVGEPEDGVGLARDPFWAYATLHFPVKLYRGDVAANLEAIRDEIDRLLIRAKQEAKREA